MLNYNRLVIPWVCLSVLFLGACNQQEAIAPVKFATTGYIPEEQQRTGQAEKGHKLLTDHSFISCGIPYSAYQKTARPTQKKLLLTGRTGRNQQLPYFFSAHTTSKGVELVTSNCLFCHAGYFNDELIIGLGNELLDFTQDQSVNAERLGAYISGPLETEEWQKWADRMATIAPYIITDTIGVNPAINLTWALIAHRDPQTLAWSEQAVIELPVTSPLPVSVPPWWRMKKKHAMFYNGEGRGDHARLMILASTLCTDSITESNAIDAMAADIRAYIATLSPPKYPFPIDPLLVDAGHKIFIKTCSRCHGSYGDHASYPNLLVPLPEIGTDPELAKHAMGNAGQSVILWFNQSYYGETSRIEPAPAYIAPPLDGVWATAPFLHNGSVPNIKALLDSSIRPKFWQYPSAPPDFNQQTLGWNVIALEYGKAAAKNKQQRKQIYDTTRPGYANSGHLFADHLSEVDRAALLEYLKTL